jgi:hypothetical protein
MNNAIESRFFRQDLRRSQQHRHVAIMTAGVHLAEGPGCIRTISRLVNVQRIHVRPQTDRTIATA